MSIENTHVFQHVHPVLPADSNGQRIDLPHLRKARQSTLSTFRTTEQLTDQNMSGSTTKTCISQGRRWEPPSGMLQATGVRKRELGEFEPWWRERRNAGGTGATRFLYSLPLDPAREPTEILQGQQTVQSSDKRLNGTKCLGAQFCMRQNVTCARRCMNRGTDIHVVARLDRQRHMHMLKAVNVSMLA